MYLLCEQDEQCGQTYFSLVDNPETSMEVEMTHRGDQCQYYFELDKRKRNDYDAISFRFTYMPCHHESCDRGS